MEAERTLLSRQEQEEKKEDGRGEEDGVVTSDPRLEDVLPGVSLLG